MSHDDAARNREAWNSLSDSYQGRHGGQRGLPGPAWGGWSIPESELAILGDVAGKDVLEFGCGAAQWSIHLAQAGARPVGVDISERQLEHARRLMAEAGVDFPLVLAPAHAVPLADESFDIVFDDHGAMTWADPYLAVPEAARLLRPGGLLAFNMSSALVAVCSAPGEPAGELLRTPYFGLHRIEEANGTVSFQLPVGTWIRLLRENGFEIEALVELRPSENATSTWEDEWVPLPWALRWPSENVWKARKR